EAAATLQRTMACQLPAVELRAAVAVFEQALRGAEFVDLIERVTALERRGGGGGWWRFDPGSPGSGAGETGRRAPRGRRVDPISGAPFAKRPVVSRKCGGRPGSWWPRSS